MPGEAACSPSLRYVYNLTTVFSIRADARGFGRTQHYRQLRHFAFENLLLEDLRRKARWL